MLKLDGGPIEVRMLTPGSNWLKVGSMMALGLTGYYSPLPDGSTVSVHTGHTGKFCLSGPELVDAGHYHFGMTTPPWLLRCAAEGRGAFGFGEKRLRLKAVGAFPHNDQMAFAVRRDLGIKSIRELKEKKVPLRISTAPTHLGHPTGWVLDAVLAEYGMEIEDFERWGGEVIYTDRQPNFMETVPTGNRDRVTDVKSGAINAVFDEAIMTHAWKEITDNVDMTFLPVDRDVLEAVDRKYYMRTAILPKGRLRGIEQDTPTIDFAQWIVFCREDLPDRLVYLLLDGLDQQRRQIESLFQPGQGLTSEIRMSEMWKNLELDLHPGALQYYRERGHMK
jgi:TRAP-type uncharacterized transport system substrate-binding protein